MTDLDPDRRRRQLEVGRHGGDRQPPPGLPGRLRRGRARRDGGRTALRRRHRPGLAAVEDGGGDGRPRGVPGRPDRRRPLQRPVGLRPGALGPGRRRRRRPAHRGRGAGRAPRRRRQPGPAARRGARRGGRLRPRQAHPRRRPGLGHRGLRRLGRAADRRVDRQAGPRHPARRASSRVDAPGAHGARRRARRRRGRGAAAPAPRSASPARSARSSSAGSTPPRWPGGSSRSTRSTSRTSPRARRTPRRSSPAGLPDERPAATVGAIEVYGSGGVLDGVDLDGPDGLSRALQALLARRPGARLPRGDGLSGPRARRRARPSCARRWRAAPSAPSPSAGAPRFLHSTGQYHKGGPQVGAFLQLTGAVADDLQVPDRPYTFGVLQAAQAAGDRKALADRHRPLLHLHLTDRAAGLDQLRAALT